MGSNALDYLFSQQGYFKNKFNIFCCLTGNIILVCLNLLMFSKIYFDCLI